MTLPPKSCKDSLCINKTGLDWFVLFQVYSQVKNVLRVHVYDTSTEEDIHINQLLIDEDFAMYQEESHASKVIQLADLTCLRVCQELSYCTSESIQW